MITPQCLACRHLRDGRDPAMACAAFPSGIPDAILTNRHDHRQPFEGDGGVRFEPRPGEQHPFGAVTITDTEPGHDVFDTRG